MMAAGAKAVRHGRILRLIAATGSRIVWMKTNSAFSALDAPMPPAWVNGRPVSTNWLCQNPSKAASSALKSGNRMEVGVKMPIKPEMESLRMKS